MGTGLQQTVKSLLLLEQTVREHALVCCRGRIGEHSPIYYDSRGILKPAGVSICKKGHHPPY